MHLILGPFLVVVLTLASHLLFLAQAVRVEEELLPSEVRASRVLHHAFCVVLRLRVAVRDADQVRHARDGFVSDLVSFEKACCNPDATLDMPVRPFGEAGVVEPGSEDDQLEVLIIKPGSRSNLPRRIRDVHRQTIVVEEDGVG